jgi:hypothetical protein
VVIKVFYAQHSPLFPGSMLDLMLDKPSNVPYREVASIDPEDLGMSNSAEPEEVLGRVWRTMNCVDGDPDTEICVRLRVRSMMVGDRVVLEQDGRKITYQCKAVGWKTVE